MGRTERFSDPRVGFAARLLVADLAVSFLTTDAVWLAHTALTDRLARADPLLRQLNLLLLLVVAFLPFPTRLASGHPIQIRQKKEDFRASADITDEKYPA